MQIVELEMVPLSLRPVLQRLYDMKTTQSALREGVLFSTKRNNYYYDTGTGKVIVLDDDTSYIFRVLFDPTLSAETFLISLTKVDPNAVKNLLQTIDAERLFQRPPLLSMGKEIAAGVTDTEQKVEQIILEVTEQCNFRCKYCVYSEDFSGNRDFGNRRMPTEIAFKAIDWALENSGAKLAITFYGGEPLLNFKLMKAVIERSQAKRGNKEIVYSFTSNMSLMTREIATYLAQVPNLYIMASIDGPRTVVDRELIVKKYVEEFAAQSKDICDKCWAYNLCRVSFGSLFWGLSNGLRLVRSTCTQAPWIKYKAPFSRFAPN